MGMANHGLELLLRALARVGEVDLMYVEDDCFQGCELFTWDKRMPAPIYIGAGISN